MKLRQNYYELEEFIHREIQDYVCKSAQEGFKLSIQSSYKLYKNLHTNTIRADIQKERVNIVNAIPIYNTSQKNNKKYTPDIILYTDNNREIYCEISVYKSVNTADYFDEWKVLGKTVIEIRKTEIMDMHLDGYRLSKDLIISYLYDPILDKARKQKISESQKIIDKSNNIISKHKNLNKENNVKENNSKEKIREKEYKEFDDKVNYNIKKNLNNLNENNILIKEYVDKRTDKQKRSDKRNGREPKKELVYFDVKANKEARIIYAVIMKNSKRAYRSIPAIIGKYLRDDGYKVGVAGKKRK
ncbi:hypothetical protein [Clostridioides difficile]|uniref:hypothetical protein n=1 Tax=Clostridioides difficile TaxID=1496 RepID=UPI00117A1D9A|nr:hypothetical protein [Clostridioides difficile]EKS7184976.1 hypothetical protein [Clostridioides difficile]